MTVSLGGIVLSDSLTLPGIHSRRKIATDVRQTLGGLGVVQHAPIQSGEAITLSAEGGGGRVRGYFTTAQVESIEALEALGEPVTLVHHLGSWQVVIIGKDLAGIDNFLDPDGDDLYVGTITMIEV
jgi:hypothetical protein